MVNQQRPDGKLFELALFAGAGGGILGGHLLGWKTVGAVEREPYAASVLLARQNDGILPPFPIWDNVQTFRIDNPECAGFIEFLRSIRDRLVISGGFPCQDISAAGKGAGITGERSGLWKEFARIIGEIQPAYAFIENSPMLVNRGLDVVLCDLAKMGYDAEWGIVSAENAGALHKRERLWILCNATKQGLQNGRGASMANTGKKKSEFKRPDSVFGRLQGQGGGKQNQQWENQPNICRMVNGMAARVDRLKAIGNGQVPVCAATAFQLLNQWE